MDQKQKDAIIDDILTLRPKGEEGENPTYVEEEYYCYDASKYKKRTNCEHANWGYKPDTLFALGLRTHSDVQEYVARRFFDTFHYNLRKKGQKASCSRKVNRIWTRISTGVEQVKSEGRPGIYTINKRWSSIPLATVWAETHDQALAMGKMFYGHVLPDDGELRSNFVRLGEQEEVIPVNVKAIQDLEREIKSNKDRIKRLQDEIDTSHDRIMAIQMMQSHMLSAIDSHVEQS